MSFSTSTSTPSVGGGAPFKLSDADFEILGRFIRRESAIVLGEDKRYHLQTRLEALAQSRGETLPDLVARARRADDSLRTAIVEAVTVHETLFFRDARVFSILRERLLPCLIEARRIRRSLVIWSAACATGQEPYSLAMTLLEYFPELADWNVRIVATDISEQALQKARAGVYTKFEVNRGLPAVLLTKYFEHKALRWSVAPSVRRIIEFRQFNLLDPWLGPRPDLVLMRNVLIYFDQETKKAILQRLSDSIAPDGMLLLGTPETTWGICDAWERLSEKDVTYFKRATRV